MAALWAVRAFCAAGLLLLLDFTWGSFCLQASAVMRSQKSGRCVQAKGEVWEDYVVDVIVPIFNEGRVGDRYTVEAVKHLIRVAKGEEEEVSDANPIASNTPNRRKRGRLRMKCRTVIQYRPTGLSGQTQDGSASRAQSPSSAPALSKT